MYELVNYILQVNHLLMQKIKVRKVGRWKLNLECWSILIGNSKLVKKFYITHNLILLFYKPGMLYLILLQLL